MVEEKSILVAFPDSFESFVCRPDQIWREWLQKHGKFDLYLTLASVNRAYGALLHNRVNDTLGKLQASDSILELNFMAMDWIRASNIVAATCEWLEENDPAFQIKSIGEVERECLAAYILLTRSYPGVNIIVESDCVTVWKVLDQIRAENPTWILA